MATVQEVITWLASRDEGVGRQPELIQGDADAQVEAVVVAWSANMDVLREAGERFGACLVLTRTDPTYAPPVGFDPAIVPDRSDWQKVVGDDPVVQTKNAYAEEHRIALAAAPWLWDLPTPQTRSLALAERIGLGEPSEANPLVVRLGETMTTAELARTAARAVGTSHSLVVGDPSTTVRRVAVVAGMCEPFDIAGIVNDPQVDAVIAGEAVEWEAVPFVQDINQTGRRLCLVALGNAVSENPATVTLAVQLSGDDPPVQVVPIEVAEPASAVRKVVA